MSLSVLDIFKIGVGPSSSHTMGPMNAACAFATDLQQMRRLDETARIGVQVYGSLALTGQGHCTDRAVLLGLEGWRPESAEPAQMEPALARIRGSGRLRLLGLHEIPFDEPMDLLFHRDQTLPLHPNGMRYTALDAEGGLVHREEFYSTGGGFIVRAADFGRSCEGEAAVEVPYPFTSARELLDACRSHGLELHELVLANEGAWRPAAETRAALLGIRDVMVDCIERGFRGSGLLPGVLKVRRRAARLSRLLAESPGQRPLEVMDWVNAFALAVNEENAAGGRVVTAPTNGAAGIIPAVLSYYRRFEPGATEDGVLRLLLVAGVIGILYKQIGRAHV